MPFGVEGLEFRKGKGFGVVRGGGSSAIPRYALTTLGKIKAEDGSITGDKGEIMSALDGDAAGEMTKRELITQTRLPESQVGVALKRLERIGYIQKVAG